MALGVALEAWTNALGGALARCGVGVRVRTILWLDVSVDNLVGVEVAEDTRDGGSTPSGMLVA